MQTTRLNHRDQDLEAEVPLASVGILPLTMLASESQTMAESMSAARALLQQSYTILMFQGLDLYQTCRAFH